MWIRTASREAAGSKCGSVRLPGKRREANVDPYGFPGSGGKQMWICTASREETERQGDSLCRTRNDNMRSS